MKFDKIYVLAINHTQEKIDSIVKKLSVLETDGVTTYEILVGHNGWQEELPEGAKIYENWGQPESWNDFWKKDVQPGEVGCTLSHISAWKKIGTLHCFTYNLFVKQLKRITFKLGCCF